MILSPRSIPVRSLAIAALALFTTPSCKHSADSNLPSGSVQSGVRVIDVAVTESGFEPDRIIVRKGEPVRLLVTRKTDRTCANEIVIKGQSIEKPLPLGQPVVVEFTPGASGDLRYACAMNMISGVIVVQ